MSEEQDRGSLDEFERALSGLQPRKAAIDRDRLMFLAGQAAGQRSRGSSKFWPVSTVMVAILAGASGHFSGSYVTGKHDSGRIAAKTSVRRASPAKEISPHPTSVAIEPDAPSRARIVERRYAGNEATYITLRDSVVLWGVDAFPSQVGNSASRPTQSYLELRRSILDGSTPAGLNLPESNDTNKASRI